MNIAPARRCDFRAIPIRYHMYAGRAGPSGAVSLILNEYLHNLLNNTNNTNNKSFKMINSSVLVTFRMR